MDEDEFPATQSVLPSLLRDVVAFVEVRSGHDNRSRGVISELRSLGASIAPTLNKDVTHVVFQGGHVSTFKKAKQQMCYVVAVTWIEASKELGCKAPEEEHPPPGLEKYKDPHASKKIRVLKSMQPDFDSEKDEERLNAILARIKKKGAKRSASTENEVSNDKPETKKRSRVSDKKKNESTSSLSRSLNDNFGQKKGNERTEKLKRRGFSTESKTTKTAENCSPPKRTRKGSVKIGSRSDEPSAILSCLTNGMIEVDKIRGKADKADRDDNGKNGVHTIAQETSRKSFEFVMPNPVKKQKSFNDSTRPTAAAKKEGLFQTSSSGIHLVVQTARSESENEDSDISDRKTKEGRLPFSTCDGRLAQSRPLVFIENISREKKAELEAKAPLHVTQTRQTRRSGGPPDSVQENTNAGNQKCQPDTKESNAFVAKVLEVLAKTKTPQVHMKSPWRRHNVANARRQSPRLSALRNENNTAFGSAHSDTDERMSPQRVSVPQKIEPRRNVALGSASAYMVQFRKAQPCKVTSPEVALLDISFGPANISESQSSLQSDTVSTDRSASSIKRVEITPCKQGTSDETPSKFLPETVSFELTDADRSDSPILGTRVKHRLLTSVLSSSRLFTQTSSFVTPLKDVKEMSTAPAAPQEVNKKIEMVRVNGNSLPSPVVNSSELVEVTRNGSLDLTRPSCRRSRLKEKLPTLVCTHLTGSDVKKVMKAVRDLGKFEFEEQVSERTSHVVASGPRRTINMLRAVARGCWILKIEWIYQSVKAGRWLREDDFELTEFSPMVQERRLLRQTSSGLGQWDLLSSVGPIFVSSATRPRPSDLKNLIHLSGGSISKTADEAAIFIGQPHKSSNSKSCIPRVAPVWILDCIQKGVQLPFLKPEYTKKA